MKNIMLEPRVIWIAIILMYTNTSQDSSAIVYLHHIVFEIVSKFLKTEHIFNPVEPNICCS